MIGYDPTIEIKMQRLFTPLSEKDKRRYAGLEAEKLGHGGVDYISQLPILWTDAVFAATAEFWEDARSFGLRHGWAQSMRDSNGAIGMLTLARSNDLLTETELAAKRFKMAWLTQSAHLAMSRCLLPKWLSETNLTLSNREIAVLRWTADGKTAGEISSILKISERTVNFHITNVMTKLNTTNKTAAAVKAAMLGLL